MIAWTSLYWNTVCSPKNKIRFNPNYPATHERKKEAVPFVAALMTGSLGGPAAGTSSIDIQAPLLAKLVIFPKVLSVINAPKSLPKSKSSGVWKIRGIRIISDCFTSPSKIEDECFTERNEPGVWYIVKFEKILVNSSTNSQLSEKSMSSDFATFPFLILYTY